jgi:DNA-binding winged helix-turn-helix (wHTH) protein
MIPKSGYRFSEEIMRQRSRMIPKSGYRFSEEIMRQR